MPQSSSYNERHSELAAARACRYQSCLINAQPLTAHHSAADENEMSSCQVVVWVRPFIKPDLFDNNVPFDNTTPIYLINLLWKLVLGLGLDLNELHYFRIFRGE